MVFNVVAHGVTEQRAAQRRGGGSDEDAVGLLLNGTDEELLAVLVAVALVDDLDDGGVFNGMGVLVAFDNLVISDHVVNLADARLHLALAVLGGVVVAVFREVPEQASRLDDPGDLGATHGREFVVLGLKFVESLLGNAVDFAGHSLLV